MEYKMENLKINDKSAGSGGSKGPNWNSDHNNGRILVWEDMNLRDDLIRGIRQMKFKPPSTIQQQAIIPYINGRDVIAQAQSGTGKTAAFAIAILQTIDTSINESQALILTPTRELARQIHNEVSQLGKYMRVRCYTSIGGTTAKKDAKALAKGFHVVIGTPGRILDMIEREALRTDYIKFFVLDECDQLIYFRKLNSRNRNQGFKEIPDISEALERTVQVFLSSATMPPELLHKSKQFMKNPFKILVKDEELTLRGLDQFYVRTGNSDDYKFDTFVDLYQRIIKSEGFETSKIQMFVYCNTKRKVVWLVEMLEAKEEIIVAGMHSGTENRRMAQNEREMILREFRKGWSRVIITTDLLGRGIDVTDVEIVINYDMPDDNETYMHRVGRSGRFGRTGRAINLINDEQSGRIGELQEFYHTQIDPLPDNLF